MSGTRTDLVVVLSASANLRCNEGELHHVMVLLELRWRHEPILSLPADRLQSTLGALLDGMRLLLIAFRLRTSRVSSPKAQVWQLSCAVHVEMQKGIAARPSLVTDPVHATTVVTHSRHAVYFVEQAALPCAAKRSPPAAALLTSRIAAVRLAYRQSDHLATSSLGRRGCASFRRARRCISPLHPLQAEALSAVAAANLARALAARLLGMHGLQSI